MKNEALALAVPAGIVGAMYFLTKKSFPSQNFYAKITHAEVDGNMANILGASCSGSVTRSDGETFDISVTYDYNLSQPRDIGFTIYISQYEIAGTSGGVTKNGSGTDTTILTSDAISGIPDGTYDLTVELWMFPVGSIVGDIIDTVTCPNAVTISNVETASISSVTVS